jgi:cellulose synthase (UDP-forming)
METIKITKANPPSKKEKIYLRLLIFVGLISLGVFVTWFFSENRVGYRWLYWPLTFAFLYKIFRKLHEWYHYYDLTVPARPELKRDYTVDILTTWCPGEPKDMIVTTLKAMQAITYPHTSYLCDEGNDEELKNICKELGVVHVTRTVKKDAKAGNINNALYNHAKGEIAIVLDPDHIPRPEFIDRVLPYFQDPQVGFVQSVQAYSNRRESFVALGAAEQTYHFYGPMMMCMNTYGTAQAIGANCAFRRTALDSIGGHAAGLSEDMHTSMRLHSKGWKSVYIPEILTRGLVPATMSGYFKQQLKWSRGTFDLLFYYLPALYRKFTIRQKIHYLTLPFHFLCGLITAIDIFIPIASLLLTEVPWLVKFTEFSAYCTPMIIISLLIRMYVQKWLLESHERGFHMVGGLLRIGTWWIFLLGFIYTIFKIKVPYIPTPKDDEPVNDWKLSIPNIAVILLSVFAIVYGLYNDWSPYSICMAGFAMVNILILTYNVVIAQQKLLAYIYALFQTGILKSIEYRTRLVWWYFRHSFYFMLRHASVILSGGGVAFVALYIYFRMNDNILLRFPDKMIEKEIGTFYAGVASRDPKLVSVDNYLNLEVVYGDWTDASVKMLWQSISKARDEKKYVFLRFRNFPADSIELLVCRKFRNMLRNTGTPVFIGFTKLHHGSPEDSKNKWKNFVDDFRTNGIGNAVWVWHSPREKHSDYYPGNTYVDWVEVSYKDKVNRSGRQVHFSEIYRPYRKFYLWIDKPVIITDIQADVENESNPLLKQTLTDIKNHLEIKGIIFLNSTEAKLSPMVNTFLSGIKTENNNNSSYIASLLTREPYKEISHKNLIIPHSVKGVVYNMGDSWNDEELPLTRKRLDFDLKKIKEMGANTIRRYKPSMFDKNIFSAAEENGLKIIYGLWFDPQIDYSKDSTEIDEAIENLDNIVNKYKDHPALLAWCLGHETLKDFNYYYAPPYQYKVKLNYFRFLELAARRIKKADGKHPVITALEYNTDISSNLTLLKNFVPSADIAGMNIYDITELNPLDEAIKKYYDKSYTVIQYGTTPGKNNSEISQYLNHDYIVVSDKFRKQWNFCNQKNERKIPGGIAFCWTDESLNKNNWNGISDYKGRLKPVYYTFKSIYSGVESKPLMDKINIDGPTLPVIGGQEYEFAAILGNQFKSEYKYEWHFSADNYYYNPSGIKQIENGRKIKVFIPQIPADYTLYLSVSDENGNVVTSAIPVRIK